MKRPYDEALDVCATAADLFTGERKETYGDPLFEFGRIGAVWAGLLDLPAPLEPHTVAAMLAGMKLVRSQASPLHRDTWIDLAAYAALGSDVAQRDHELFEPLAAMRVAPRWGTP